MAERATFTVFTHPSIRRVIRSASLARVATDIGLTVLTVVLAFATIGASLLLLGLWWFFLRRPPPRPEVVIGSDGVRFIQAGRDAFVPWTRVVDLEETDQGVRLQLLDGSHVQAFVGLGESDPLTADLAHRAARALRLARKRAEPEHASRLARGKRTIAEWLAALGDIDPRGGGYRNAPLGERDLWDVAEHPGAPIDSRVAACVLLSRLGQDGTAERLGKLASSTAQPKLESAIEVVLEEEETSERRALERV